MRFPGVWFCLSGKRHDAGQHETNNTLLKMPSLKEVLKIGAIAIGAVLVYNAFLRPFAQKIPVLGQYA